MKNVFFLVVTIALPLFSSCNSCSKSNQPEGVVMETDSLYMVNDSTIADLQTYTFEGVVPMKDGKPANVVLTIQTLNLDEDGTYTSTVNYIDEAIMQETDNGDVLVLIGVPNDSTAIVYELVSENKKPKTHFMLSKDSSLVKLDNKMNPASNDPAHKLMHKNK